MADARSIAPLLLLLLTAAALAGGCELLYPPPSERKPHRIPSTDAELHAALFNPELGCHDRLSDVAWLLACHDEDTALGEEARCALEPPLRELAFGCGREGEPLVPDPKQPFPERLRLELDPAHQALVVERFEALYGPCRIAGEGPAVGEPERFAGDRGTRACFAPTPTGLDSGLRRYPGGRDGIPMGIYLELAPVAPGEGARPVARAIGVETELLSEAERALALAELPRLLELGRPGL